MKSIKIFIILGLLLLSCEDYLDMQPTDMLTLDEVFAKKQYTEEYLANVYSYIPQYGDGDAVNLTPACDEADFVWNGVPGNNINLGNWGPQNTVYHIWPSMYRGIRSASTFINRVDECSELTEEARTIYKAEARFLRAYYYHLLMRQYGPVVIMDELMPVDVDPQEIQKPRNTYDECVNYIVSELDKAIIDLPDKITDRRQLGRPDKIAALALKSRVLLYAASPLFNGNTDYANFRNPDGTQLISQTYDENKWKDAADAAKAVIDLMPQGLYKKYDENGNYDPLASYRDIYFDNWNKEIIWGKYTGTGAGSWEWNCGLPQLGNAYANYGVTQQLVDAYFMDNGYLPIIGYNSDGSPIINPNSNYVESGVTEKAGKYTVAGIWNMYANRDPRFYACVTFNGSEWIWHGDDGNSRWFAEFFATGKDGRLGGASGSEPTKTGYVIRKYSHPSSDVNRRRLWNNAVWIHFRLAEIYLNYAEALNEYNPRDTDIMKYLNLIRERAGIPQYGIGENALPMPSSQEEVRNLIWAERRIELAFEMHRIFDVRRWKIAPITEGGPMYGMNVLAGNSLADPAFYERTIFETRVFEEKHYFWPLHQNELDRDKALVQNPGW